jgi:hypothetical protein
LRAKEYLSRYPIPLYTGDDIRYRDRQLRHRIYQSALKGELNAIIDKAREYGVPVLMVDPRNTSKICQIHRAVIEYGEARIGICSKGGEKWHREVVALINLYFKALKTLYKGYAQKSFGVSSIDGSPFPLGSLLGVEAPRWPQGCYNIPVDREAKQPKTNACRRHSTTIGGQAEGNCQLNQRF